MCKSGKTREGAGSVGDIIASPEFPLSRLLTHARYLLLVQEKIRSLLPIETAQAVRVAGATVDTITVVTPSSAIAFQLRNESERLLSNLNSSGERRFKTLDIRIMPSLNWDESEHRKKPRAR